MPILGGYVLEKDKNHAFSTLEFALYLEDVLLSLIQMN